MEAANKSQHHIAPTHLITLEPTRHLDVLTCTRKAWRYAMRNYVQLAPDALEHAL